MAAAHKQVYGFGALSKQRPVVTRGRAFTPRRTLEFEQAVAEGWTGPKFEGPCYMIVELHADDFTVEVGELDPNTGKRPRRGDADNYIKAIADGLNGVAYGDDKQVWFVVAAFGNHAELLRTVSEQLRGL